MMPLSPKKSFGQNFLQSTSVVERIILSAHLAPGDAVLEIGPGRGVLTKALIDTGARVTAIEADADLIPGLLEQFGDSLQLLPGDARKKQSLLDFDDFSYTLVANLPYHVASHIIRTYLHTFPRPKELVVMVQKEVADRMAAKPPHMSVLSVACQLYAEVTRLFVVPPGAFFPVPKVQSAVVRLVVKKHPTQDAEQIIHLAKIGFSARRKFLLSNIAKGYALSKEKMESIFLKMKLPLTIRAEEMSVAMWIELYQQVNSTKAQEK